MLTEAMCQVIDALTTKQEDRLLVGKLVGRHESLAPYMSTCPECLLEVAAQSRATFDTLAKQFLADNASLWRAYGDFECFAKIYGSSKVANAIRERILENRASRQLQAEETCSTQS